MKCFNKDGPWFSPDGGNCYVVGDLIYWEDGDITPNTGMRRGLPQVNGEDYSAWTDEKREQVKAEWAKKRAEWKAEQDRHKQERAALIQSAKSKLTEDEFKAVASIEYYEEF